MINYIQGANVLGDIREIVAVAVGFVSAHAPAPVVRRNATTINAIVAAAKIPVTAIASAQILKNLGTI